jgi:HEAT repeat protein
MLARLLLASTCAVVLAAPFAGAQDGLQDEARKLFNEGKDLYLRGKFAESYSKFEQAFQKQPSSDLVYAFIQRAGVDVVTGMMTAKDENMRNVGYRLFELAGPAGNDRIRKGKAVIEKYIEDLRDNDLAVQQSARWHLKNIGPYAARFLVPFLGHAQADLFRSRVILTLTEMGTDVSLAVAEALNSKNATMRQNAAVVLGNIKDDRTVPALRRSQSNPNETPEVRKLAHEALIKITRQSEDKWKEAKEYYLDLAENLYNQSPAAVHVWNRAWLVWHWDEEKDVLTEREVARFVWAQQLAEESIYDALALDPDYRREGWSPWSLLVCVHFQQAVDAEGGTAAAEAALKGNDPGFLPEHLESLKKMLEGADRNKVLAKVPGRAHMYEALGRCLRDGNAGVAVEILETLKAEGSAADLPAAGADAAASPGGPLILALTHDDKRVRYAAAETYVALTPKEEKLGKQLVIPNLVDALGESGVRVALVIYDVQDDNDRNYINALTKLLNQANVFPVIARSGGEGVVKAKQFPTEDVVIIQRKVAGQIYFKEEPTSRKRIVETVYDTLRDDVRTRSMPRVLLGDNPAELEESRTAFGSTAQGFIGKSAGMIEWRGLFERLFAAPEAQKDSKDRADKLALAAAESLASIDPANTHLEVREAVDALIKSVDPTVMRADPIRVAAARALGRFGDQRAVDVLAKALAVKAEDPEQAKGQKAARLQFARALAQIFQQVRMAPSKEVFENLKKQLLDGDLDIESAAGEALGNADLTSVQRLDVEKVRRVNIRRGAKTPADD